MPGNVTGSNPVPIAVWLHIYHIDINISRKYEVEKQKKKIFEIAYYKKIAILVVSETYFPLEAPYQEM